MNSRSILLVLLGVGLASYLLVSVSPLSQSSSKVASEIEAAYDRDSFGFISYKSGSNRGFYTNEVCEISIDHVVSLKDAFHSGASSWTDEERSTFSNDRGNHVSACRSVNSSKGAAVPAVFLTRSDDGIGLDYGLVRVCEYLEIYFFVKITYGLSFDVNNPELFASCGLNIE